VVVLDELGFDAELGENAATVGLEEEPARVAVDRRLDQERAVEAGVDSSHRPDIALIASLTREA
jgi:hypothetical protein